ncbi:UDP-4-amino-4,6-dideoxy-N-acetyl-beta-L-altrosamine transaminase [Plebeiibacterium marinum]|uniref:UDP-4-amino-4, 6-dideoxy-N-acetyl-beta-L-altrosamine transaminase n=1 Tax=Plebeiibacterium marinum TaxID=2992111 RepID=A0AAE3MGL1_9BACT|nr:UDP-4-amino-4,6-dideoxy-N-acetyl-beta-L-altrosamine transaminase [Plebeiobacterium marinum]MCW3807463.1 UDP-4-amino-4,6-dideoxy-N-acetyl-beta-L-altrosamine transaminase [Plebeiobacterium marinum]
MKPISYGRQSIAQEDIDAVVETLKSEYLTQGPQIKEFEEKFAKYVDTKYAVAVANGTVALHLCAMALDVQPGDKWLTTPITFAASANCIKYCGGEIEFVDIDPETYCIDIDKIEQKLISAPAGTYKGIIPVDFAGYPVDIEKIYAVAKKYDLKIIEDACHAPGGYFIDSKEINQKCGNSRFADLAIFSFHPVKHIATGEGGMVTTNDKELYDKLCLYRTHGITKDENLMDENHGGWYYEMVELGYNYRLSDMQAALGISQLKRAAEGVSQRQKIADSYTKAFSEIEEIQTPVVPKNVSHAYHLYVIQVDDRKGLYEHLREAKIFSQVHYIPVHTMPYYKKQGWKKGDMPVAEAYYKKCLSLPMFPTLSNEEQQYVINKVIEFVSK